MLQFTVVLLGLYRHEHEDGQGLVEYALIIAFIAVVVIVAMLFLREQIGSLFSKVGNSVSGCGSDSHPLPPSLLGNLAAIIPAPSSCP